VDYEKIFRFGNTAGAGGDFSGLGGAAVENCGCFGEIYRSGLGVGFFVRNGALLFLALLLVWLQEAETAAPKRTELQPNHGGL
jgi:hypothetical protein